MQLKTDLISRKRPFKSYVKNQNPLSQPCPSNLQLLVTGAANLPSLYFILVFHMTPKTRAPREGGGIRVDYPAKHLDTQIEGLSLQDLPEGEGLIRGDTIAENCFLGE
jgi:hypothetical protein